MRTLLYNAKILTMNEKAPEANSLIINQDKIEFVGNFEDLNPEQKKIKNQIDLQQKILLPSFIDTHTHFFEFAKREIYIDFKNADNLQDFKSILQKYKDENKNNFPWIEGGGWDPNLLENPNFTKKIIDKIFPETPVSLSSQDMHTIICNSSALKKAGITSETENPKGGKIGKDKNNKPNGILYEQAWNFIENSKPELSFENQKKIVKNAVQKCYQFGLSYVHVMENEDKFNLYKKMVKEDLNFRFCWHFPENILDKMITKKIESYTKVVGEKLKIGGMKIFMDGSLGSKTAYMFKPYNNSQNFGSIPLSKEELYNLTKKGAEKDISSSIHAIGNRCNLLVLNVLKRIKSEFPKTFPRIEHLQCIRKEDLLKLKNSGIYCAVQPIHIKSDIPNIKKNIPHSEDQCYQFKELIKNKIPCGFGSDAPVEDINPFRGIYSAIERKFNNEPKNESWLPEQKISVMEAIKKYTIDAAKASKSEKEIGSLEIGKLADMIVIDDFTKLKNEFWLTAESKMTIINGEIVKNFS